MNANTELTFWPRQDTERFTLSYLLSLRLMLDIIEQHNGKHEFIDRSRECLENIFYYTIEDAGNALAILDEILYWIEDHPIC